MTLRIDPLSIIVAVMLALMLFAQYEHRQERLEDRAKQQEQQLGCLNDNNDPIPCAKNP